MKKSLVLAMAMALGVTASAYAANPFNDVPAGHWAYDSISKLAAAGVIEGYGDDTFRGDRLMTRYEMAQIVAKAMAKGANVDKLAAEFADELDALGVRVAALEKKTDNVKITGNIRWRYRNGTSAAANGPRRVDHDLRTRLWFRGTVNQNWQYVAMIENTQVFHNAGNTNARYVGEDNAVAFQRAYAEGRLGGAKVTAGRYHEELVGGDSDVYSQRIDGVKVQYGNKVKLMGWYGKTSGNAANSYIGGEQSWGAHLDFALGKKANLFVGYDEFKAPDANYSALVPRPNDKRKIFDVGVKANFKDVRLTAIYLNGKSDQEVATDKKNGFTVELAYKGAKAGKPGSWGINAKYYDLGNLTYLPAIGTFGGKGAYNAADASGFKGFRVGADYAIAKNMVARVAYFDLKGKAANARKIRTFYSEMIMTF